MSIQLNVGSEIIRFDSYQDWVDSASAQFRRFWARHGRIGHVCIDSKGRVCEIGKQFMRARDEQAYPIVVYAIDPEFKLENA